MCSDGRTDTCMREVGVRMCGVVQVCTASATETGTGAATSRTTSAIAMTASGREASSTAEVRCLFIRRGIAQRRDKSVTIACLCAGTYSHLNGDVYEGECAGNPGEGSGVYCKRDGSQLSGSCSLCTPTNTLFPLNILPCRLIQGRRTRQLARQPIRPRPRPLHQHQNNLSRRLRVHGRCRRQGAP